MQPVHTVLCATSCNEPSQATKPSYNQQDESQLSCHRNPEPNDHSYHNYS